MVLRKRDDGSKEEALQEGAPLVGGSGGAAKPGGRVAHYTGTGWPMGQKIAVWVMPHLISGCVTYRLAAVVCAAAALPGLWRTSWTESGTRVGHS